MKEYLITDAIGYIDMDLLAEHLDKKKIFREKIKKKNKYKYSIVAVLASSICCFLLVYQFVFKDTRSFGNIDDYRILLEPPVAKGNKFTENEIEKVINDNADFIAQVMIDAYGPDNQYRIITQGYYHVGLFEDENIINYESITLPIVNRDNEIISSVSVYRYNDETFCSPNIGVNWSEKMTALISDYSNQDIIMLYVGDSIEAAITPDNKVHFINAGRDGMFEAQKDYYSIFKSSDAVFNSIILE